MENKYIGILICRSMKQDKCPLMNDLDIKHLSDEGYLNTDGTLTQKANNLLSAVGICSEVFENSLSAKQEVANVVSDMKKTLDGMFTSFRNNASGMFQTMADNIKTKQ